MDEQPVSSTDVVASKPTWRKIADFPLVALVIALAAFIAGFLAMGLAFKFLGLDLPEAYDTALKGTLAAALSVLLYKLVVVRLGEHPRDDLPLRGGTRDLLVGIAGATVLMSAIVGIVALLGGYRISGMGGATSWPMILFLAGLQAAVMEEVLFRGILLRFLESFGGSWFGLAVTSALFGLGHIANDNATLFSSLAIAVEAGILLGAAYMLTRSLWLPIGIHFGWNVTQGLIWDVPVSGGQVDGVVNAHPAGAELISGGAFGVEASVVALALATVAGLLLLVQAVRAGNLVRPWWVRRRLQREGTAAS